MTYTVLADKSTTIVAEFPNDSIILLELLWLPETVFEAIESHLYM